MNGTIVSADGHIAAMLSPGASEEKLRRSLKKITVSLPGGIRYQARLLAYDTQTGAMLLKVDASGLPFLTASDDPVAIERRLTVHAVGQDPGQEPYHVVAPVRVLEARFKVGDRDGFFAVTEAGQISLTEEYAGAPVVTSSGQLQGILGSNEEILFGPAIRPEDPTPRKAAAIPASVIVKLLEQASKQPAQKDEKTP
jgi:S1-C subfamily serine protease